MSKRKPHTPVTDFDVQLWSSHEPVERWQGTCTQYLDGVPQFTVTAVEWSASRLVNVLMSAAFRVSSGFEAGQLTLPDMGDYTVQYFDKK